MHNAIPDRPRETIRLREGAGDKIARLFECRTETELAALLGMNQSNVNRVKRGRSDIAPTFLARLLIALMAHGHNTADYFDVIDTDGTHYPVIMYCPDVNSYARPANMAQKAS